MRISDWSSDVCSSDLIGATRDAGFLRVGSLRVETTGVLGRWTDRRGVERTWAFPGWATIPTRYSLADGRRWHLSFAWLLAIALTLYMLWTVVGGHLAKDLHVRRGEGTIARKSTRLNSSH